VTELDLDHVTTAYLTCALRFTPDPVGDGDSLEDSYDLSYFSGHSKREARVDCEKFVKDNAADLDGLDPEHVGANFWLARNNHDTLVLGQHGWHTIGAQGALLRMAALMHGSAGIRVNTFLNQLEVG
jgi:hypothetical protein